MNNKETTLDYLSILRFKNIQDMEKMLNAKIIFYNDYENSFTISLPSNPGEKTSKIIVSFKNKKGPTFSNIAGGVLYQMNNFTKQQAVLLHKLYHQYRSVSHTIALVNKINLENVVSENQISLDLADNNKMPTL